MRRWLVAAGVYNLAWGAPVILFPDLPFQLVGMEPLPDPGRAIWQCLGMVIGVYGVGYACAAARPLRHWPIVLVGMLGKVLGPIGFVDAAIRGEVPWRSGWLILTNDLIWWVPFGWLLLLAWRHHRGER